MADNHAKPENTTYSLDFPADGECYAVASLGFSDETTPDPPSNTYADHLPHPLEENGTEDDPEINEYLTGVSAPPGLPCPTYYAVDGEPVMGFTSIPEWVIVANDTVFLDDSDFLLPEPILAEDIIFLDDDDFEIELEVEEDDDIVVTDEAFADPSPEEDDDVIVADEFEIEAEVYEDDDIFVDDDSELEVEVNEDDDVPLDDETTITRSFHRKFATEIRLTLARERKKFATEMMIDSFTPPAISVLTSLSNPVLPTVFYGGVQYALNAATEKTGPNYVSYLMENYFQTCDVLTANVTLQFGGGSFSITSTAEIGDIGDTMTIIGLPGVITEVLSDKGVDGKYIITSGTFSDQKVLNKQFLLVADTDPMKFARELFPTPVQQGSPPKRSITLSDMAFALGALTGITVRWATIDAPLLDVFLESGMTVGDALRSLASRVNGILAWTGNANSYVVIDPYRGFGEWEGFPINCLITNSKIKRMLDLTGQVVINPVEVQGAGNARFIDRITDILPVIRSQSFNRKIPEDGAPRYWLPPPDAGAFWKQVLPGSAQADIPGVTNADPNAWQEFTPDYVIDTERGNVKQIKFENAFFHPDLTDGKFELNVGYTRNPDPPNAASSELVDAGLQKRRVQLMAELERMRYFRKREAVVSYPFFGSIPMPGNKASYTYEDDDMEGTCEVFTANYDKQSGWNCTTTIGEYLKVRRVDAKALIDAFNINHVL